MKVLQVASGDFFGTYGGGQVYVKNIVDQMLCMGIDVAVLSSVDGLETLQIAPYGAGSIFQKGSLSDDDFAEVVAKVGPDIIHAHSLKAQACRVGKRMGIPVIVTAHHGGILCPGGALMDTDDHICTSTLSHKACLKCVLRNVRTGLGWYPMMRHVPEGLYRRMGKGIRRLPFIPFVTPIGQAALRIEQKIGEWREIADNCTLMIAPSRMIAEAMTRNGLSADKVKVVPHGVPLPPACDSVIDSRSGNRPVRFFYVGRISYIKGLHVMLEAFGKLASRDAELHIIGGAVRKDEIRYLRGLKAKYASDNRIVWHGKVASSHIYQTIREMDISVVPTICLEVFGLNVSESLAMGKPVLATRSGGPEMQITEGVNGWLVPPNDVAAMREAMERICSHRDEFKASDVKGRVIAIDEHCRSLFRIYSETMK